jgi:tetraacyldisaccharide 4'-kinase
MDAGRWRATLLPLAWGFGGLTGLRNRCFDRGLLKERGVGVPVISVGNLVAGGTGKTPFVEYLVKNLIAKVPKLAMVSRGYGRRTRGLVVVSNGSGDVVSAHVGGDEPVQVARKFPGLAVLVGEDRVAAARRAVQDLGADVIILDDGFQHRYLRRDCNILLLDARMNIARERMLPAGSRREPLRGMHRADLVVFTRVESPAASPPWEPALQRWYCGPRALSHIVAEGFCRAGDTRPMQSLPGRSCFAFSGIADHAGFVSGLRAQGILVVGDRAFPDHHRYREADLDRLTREFLASGADVLLTTEKDIMRLMAEESLKQRTSEVLPLYYARVGLKIIGGEEKIWGMIDRALGRSAA